MPQGGCGGKNTNYGAHERQRAQDRERRAEGQRSDDRGVRSGDAEDQHRHGQRQDQHRKQKPAAAKCHGQRRANQPDEGQRRRAGEQRQRDRGAGSGRRGS